MTWSHQVDKVVKSTNKTLYFLRNKCNSLPVNLRKLMVSQMIFPHFDYACSSFCTLSQTYNKRMENQLTKSIRFIFSLPKHISTDQFRVKLNWMTLAQRRKYFIAIQTFKTLRSAKPEYLKSILHDRIIDYSEAAGVETRNRPFFSIPFKTSRYTDKSFAIEASKIWNTIPAEIRLIENLETFKQHCRRHFIRSGVT